MLPKGGLHSYIAGLLYADVTDDMDEGRPVELPPTTIMVRRSGNQIGYEYLVEMDGRVSDKPSGAA
jgi:hypothetical protein